MNYCKYIGSCNLLLKVKWVGDTKEETWEPEYNVPEKMVHAFEKGEQEPSTYSQKVEKRFGITAVTNVKVKSSNERCAKRMKIEETGVQKG